MFFRLISVIVIFLIGFSGCKKDPVNSNAFTYDLVTYPLNYGALAGYGANDHVPPTFEFDLTLAGPGIKFDKTLNDFTGKGNLLGLTFYSSDSVFLPTGDYTYDGFISKDSLTFNMGVLGINVDLATDTTGVWYDIKTGFIQVVKRGNVYEFNFDLYTKEDKQVKGYFSGFLENITPSAKKNKRFYLPRN
jgi:hypothetical protein